jgi:hypothetical protein
MLRVKLMSILLCVSFLVIYLHASQAFAQKPLEQYMRCDQDPYDRITTQCILAIYPGTRSDDVSAKIECYHNNEIQTFSCRYWWASSTLEYSCTSPTGEITLFKPRDIQTNPQRVCNTLCKG